MKAQDELRYALALEIDGALYQGQALSSPIQDEHGRVVFHLTLHPVKP